MSDALTYVYCLVRSARRPSLRGVPTGLPSAEPVRLIEIAAPVSRTSARSSTKAWLVVSSVPQRAYGEDVLEREMQRLEWIGERAMAHEAVVEHFLRADALLPMQLFTIFITDARAVEHVMHDWKRIQGIFKKIQGQVEWGVRLTLEPASQEVGAPRRQMRIVSGADYLARKRDVRVTARERVQHARTDASRVYRKLAAEATAAERRTDMDDHAGSRVLLDAAFLVPARRIASFRAAVRRQTDPLKKTGVGVALTGPWPAYNFI